MVTVKGFQVPTEVEARVLFGYDDEGEVSSDDARDYFHVAIDEAMDDYLELMHAYLSAIQAAGIDPSELASVISAIRTLHWLSHKIESQIHGQPWEMTKEYLCSVDPLPGEDLSILK